MYLLLVTWLCKAGSTGRELALATTRGCQLARSAASFNEAAHPTPLQGPAAADAVVVAEAVTHLPTVAIAALAERAQPPACGLLLEHSTGGQPRRR